MSYLTTYDLYNMITVSRKNDDKKNITTSKNEELENENVTQKVTVPTPKFTLSFERRILVKPDGTEITYKDEI